MAWIMYTEQLITLTAVFFSLDDNQKDTDIQDINYLQ